MFFQDFHSIRNVIFAANRQQNAALMKIQQGPLDRLEGGARIFNAEANAFYAVFADNTAPQGVVQICHQRLTGLANERMNEP